MLFIHDVSGSVSQPAGTFTLADYEMILGDLKMLLEFLLLATAWSNPVGNVFCPMPASVRLSTPYPHLIRYRPFQPCLFLRFLLVSTSSLPCTLLHVLP